MLSVKIIKNIFTAAIAIVVVLTYMPPPATGADNGSFDFGRPTWEPIIGDREIEIGLCLGPEGQIHRSLEEIVSILNNEINPYVEWLSNGNLRIRAVEGRVTQGRHGSRTSHGRTFEALLCDDTGIGPPRTQPGVRFYGGLDSGWSDGAISYGGGWTAQYDSRSPHSSSGFYLSGSFRRYGIIPFNYRVINS